MKGNVLAAALLSIAIMAHGYLAWSKPAQSTQNRYDLVRLDDATWVRLDRITGKIKVCKPYFQEAGISCLDNHHMEMPMTLEMIEKNIRGND